MSDARTLDPALDPHNAVGITRRASTGTYPAAHRRPPALLTDATWYGTLAAVRDLGAHGVPVTLASDRFLAPARWSRYVSRTVRCPPVADARRFLEWLHVFSAYHPGHVYYPTSDDTAWLTCSHRTSLEPYLRLYLPPLGALAQLLDKWRLAQTARAAGVASPATWCPRDEAEVERLTRELAFPLIVKPRMQVLSDGSKGVLVLRREDLVGAWRSQWRSNRMDAEVSRHVPDAGLPLLQAYHSSAKHIYTIDGFVGESGDAFVTRGCTKLLQLPRGSGPGIAFEAAPVDPAVGAGLQRLFQNIGFAGVFDAEFIVEGGRPLLIDVNPRFYNHMAFEIDRGMPLPWMAYLAALGDDKALRDAVRAAQPGATESRRVYADRRSLRLLLVFQRLSGAMSRGEVRSWERWMAKNAGDMTDPASAKGDAMTEFADSLFIAQRLLQHPRSSLRNLLRTGSHAAPSEAGTEVPSKK